MVKDKTDKDRYGRPLRYVYVDGFNYSKMILNTGLGNVYYGNRKIKNFYYYLQISPYKCN